MEHSRTHGMPNGLGLRRLVQGCMQEDVLQGRGGGDPTQRQHLPCFTINSYLIEPLPTTPDPSEIFITNKRPLYRSNPIESFRTFRRNFVTANLIKLTAHNTTLSFSKHDPLQHLHSSTNFQNAFPNPHANHHTHPPYLSTKAQSPYTFVTRDIENDYAPPAPPPPSPVNYPSDSWSTACSIRR
ncbi:hypothetical protein WAI453_000242 [Rhynchosporium graminicola]